MIINNATIFATHFILGVGFWSQLTAFVLCQSAKSSAVMERSVVSSGAIEQTSPTHTVSGTIGQSISGTINAGNSLQQGFWTFTPINAATVDSVSFAVEKDITATPQPWTSRDARLIVIIPNPGHARIELLTLTNERVALLYEADMPSAGELNITVPTQSLASGDYFIVVHRNGETVSRRVVLVK